MELRDLIVTPTIVLLVFAAAYVVRPFVTDSTSQRYFIPALLVKILGAVAIGFIYQFYYSGGDTFLYHTYGSRIVWDSLVEDPSTTFRLIFGPNDSELGIYRFSSKIPFFHDESTYFVVRIASLFDLVTLSTYSATAVLFAVFSFVGMWMMFLTFYRQFPALHFNIAVATLFVPSVFFWGSGLLKDSIIMGCLGIATFQIYRLFIEWRLRPLSILLLIMSLYVIYSVRAFVLQAYLPALFVWVLVYNFNSIRPWILKMATVPIMITILAVSAYFAVAKVGEGNSKYAVANLTRTSRITAYDIGYYTGRGAGSSYALDVASWTPGGMLRASPQAINVSLFRPYLWEVSNPLMLLASLESTFLLFFTFYVIARNFNSLFSSLLNFNVLFCLSFSVVYAFAVGISTFNFGTLTRYRIPLIPFYIVAMVIINDQSKRKRKLEALETTE